MRQVVIHPGEDGYWIAECPSLPGCITQGKTREEALGNAKEAIQGYIAALEDDACGARGALRHHPGRRVSKLPRLSRGDCVNAL